MEKIGSGINIPDPQHWWSSLYWVLVPEENARGRVQGQSKSSLKKIPKLSVYDFGRFWARCALCNLVSVSEKIDLVSMATMYTTVPGASLHKPATTFNSSWINKKQTIEQCCGTVTIFYGSGSGSDFWKVMVPAPVPTFEKVMVSVPVPVPTLEKLLFRFQLHI
jgi:hypothetical protein